MTLQMRITALVGLLLLPMLFVGAASALSVTCNGAPASASITWTSSVQNAIAPISYLWGNGATSSSQTAAASAGLHTMTLSVTDASSTVATTTCSATVATASGPTISTFAASPSTIIAGQSSVLSWSVANASSTSINNGVGTVSSTSVTVSPSVTTTYTLSATNPSGTNTKMATVTVVASSTSSGTIEQIRALLAQLEGLKKQIGELLLGRITGGDTGTNGLPLACYKFNRDLKKGDSGEDVRELQRELAKADPTLFPPGLVNGNFGPKTHAALKMFQKRFGIDMSGTGYFGSKSRAHLSALCSSDDADKDGIMNSADPDDDNDGTPDVDDKRPFDKNATSTKSTYDDDKKNKGNNGKWDDNGKKKGSDDDDDDDDEDEDDDEDDN